MAAYLVELRPAGCEHRMVVMISSCTPLSNTPVALLLGVLTADLPRVSAPTRSLSKIISWQPAGGIESEATLIVNTNRIWTRPGAICLLSARQLDCSQCSDSSSDWLQSSSRLISSRPSANSLLSLRRGLAEAESYRRRSQAQACHQLPGN
jgi:hypothetical protein